MNQVLHSNQIASKSKWSGIKIDRSIYIGKLCLRYTIYKKHVPTFFLTEACTNLKPKKLRSSLFSSGSKNFNTYKRRGASQKWIFETAGQKQRKALTWFPLLFYCMCIWKVQSILLILQVKLAKRLIRLIERNSSSMEDR